MVYEVAGMCAYMHVCVCICTHICVRLEKRDGSNRGRKRNIVEEALLSPETICNT